jgi:enoyl-CoA hydratase/carnithine racemase
MTDLLYEKKGHVATLTLNRPERMNAISMEMLAQLGEALVDAEDGSRDFQEGIQSFPERCEPHFGGS